MFEALAFYAFAGITVLAGLMVISSRNPVHSVLFLVLAFFSSAGLFVLMGAEFLAMILVVVYVGAVAVLFLFVVMMLDVDFVALRQGFLQMAPVGVVIGGFLLFILGMSLFHVTIGPEQTAQIAKPVPENVQNTVALGRILYTDFIYPFQAAGLILLVAMIGAIVLTLRTRPGVRRQNVARQVARSRKDAIEMVDIKPGQGI